MPDTVAILSDIHGVLPALDAVLAEPAVRDADAIVLSGDMVTGPQPARTFDRLAALGPRAHWVKGNCERDLVAVSRGEPSAEPPGRTPFGPWIVDRLGDERLARLDSLPMTITLDVRGFGQVLCCHATPRDDEEMVFVDSDLPRWDEVLADVPDTVGTIVCGHTHMPFARLVAGRLVVNAGSVGMPYGTTGAQWALLADGAVSLRRTEFDREAACAAIVADSSHPDVEWWTDVFVRNPPSDREALTTFKEQVARQRNAG